MPELRLPVRRGRRRVVLWLVVGLGLLIFFISPLVGLLAEWPWFSALGYQRVFATRLVASLTLGVLAGGVAFAFLYANLRFAQRGIVPNPVVMPASAQTPAAPEGETELSHGAEASRPATELLPSRGQSTPAPSPACAAARDSPHSPPAAHTSR